MNTSRKTQNQLLRYHREMRGWSQRRLAEQIGTTEDKVSRWERGERTPSPYYREKMCKLFDKNAVELGLVEGLEPSLPNFTNSIEDVEATIDATTLYPNWLIPALPDPYYAHPHPLQENFTGRLYERQFLTRWLTKRESQILALVALGGMGKSALTAAWLQQDVLNLPQAERLQGIFTWSFYEPEASFPVLLDQALIYTSSGNVNPKHIASIYEKTQILVSFLQRQRFLLVLDGFERVLRAYSPEDMQGNFRVCIDSHLGNFLRWIASGVLTSNVLLISRLFPQELDGLLNCQRMDLNALNIEDSIDFLHAQGVHGTRSEMQNVCKLYGNHPLTLRLLAGLIVYDPARPGDITVADEYNPIPDIVQREHHILELAYDSLNPSLQQLLSRLAAFRSKPNYELIRVVNPLKSDEALKRGLRELVERGFLSFDREHGYYNFHPIVRRYAYDRLLGKEEIHEHIASFIQSKGEREYADDPVQEPKKIRSLLTILSESKLSHKEYFEYLRPVIELYHHKVHAKQFQEAFSLYYNMLAVSLYHRLGEYQTIIELLQDFYSDDKQNLLGLTRNQQSWLFDALAHAYSASGYPARAVQLLSASIEIDQELGYKESLASALWNLAIQQQVQGGLLASEQSLQEGLAICSEIHDSFNEAKTYQYFALLKAYQGTFEAFSGYLDKAETLFKELRATAQEGSVWAYRSLCLLLAKEYPSALKASQQAEKIAEAAHYERDIIRAKWLHGLILVRSIYQKDDYVNENLREAEKYLGEALHRCRQIDMVDYEADILLALSRLHYAKGDVLKAKEHLDEALAITNRSDFRILRADIYNLLALLALEAGNSSKALHYAQSAFDDAICDGLPYSYKPALDEATELLKKARQLNGGSND